MTGMSCPDVRPSDSGSAAVELIVVLPIFLAFIGACLVAGLILFAHQELDEAARDAVEAATVQPTAGDAAVVAAGVADLDLSRSFPRCASVSTDTNTTGFDPGGDVRVVVHCVMHVPAVSPLLPRSQVSLRASDTAPIEPYRRAAR